MKTFMLFGDVSANVGPANVHRELISHWPVGEVLLPRWSNMASKFLSVVAASVRCDVLIITGMGRLVDLACTIARGRNVPIVALVHGHLPYENEINNLGLSSEVIQEWRSVLYAADIVVTNSEYHADCLRMAEPYIARKVRWFNLGIKPFDRHEHVTSGDVIKVAVSGGTRPIKGNEVVAKAIALLQKQGHRVELLVFGDTDTENDELSDAVRRCGGRMMGQMPHGDFLDILASTDVFVMNSRRESFGMSATEALAAGASLLVSRNCGVAGILALKEEDVVSDCEDVGEVARKILHLASHPNSQRLYDALDFDELGWDAAAKRLYDICREVV